MEVEAWRIIVIVVLALTSGIFNMLNVGLIGLDPRYLEL
jgi:hypothetical protein